MFAGTDEILIGAAATSYVTITQHARRPCRRCRREPYRRCPWNERRRPVFLAPRLSFANVFLRYRSGSFSARAIAYRGAPKIRRKTGGTIILTSRPGKLACKFVPPVVRDVITSRADLFSSSHYTACIGSHQLFRFDIIYYRLRFLFFFLFIICFSYIIIYCAPFIHFFFFYSIYCILSVRLIQTFFCFFFFIITIYLY